MAIDTLLISDSASDLRELTEMLQTSDNHLLVRSCSQAGSLDCLIDLPPELAIIPIEMQETFVPLIQDKQFQKTLFLFSDPQKLSNHTPDQSRTKNILGTICLPINQRELQEKIQLIIIIHNLQNNLQKQSAQINDLTGKLEKLEHSIDEHYDFLEMLSTRDGLTGLYNRRHLADLLVQEFDRAIHYATHLSLLILDLDYFSDLNESCGHDFGDFAINEFAARITSLCRKSDTCFRFDGEIFLILMPQTDIAAAVDAAEKIRKGCKDKSFDNGTNSLTVTVSIGIASVLENRPENPDALLALADKALYKAKSEGRNRVIAWPVTEPLDDSPQNINSLKDAIGRILDKTKDASIASLQLLTQNFTSRENNKHLNQVQHFFRLFSEKLRLPEPILNTFQNTLTLHTCFRLLLHKDMLEQKTAFTTAERKTMNDFPYKLAELTDLFDYFSNERTILLSHAEWYNGKGYPEGLQGDEIPLGSRMFIITDAFAAMLAERPYRSLLSQEEILLELVNGAGKQFDPHLLLIFLALIREHSLLDVSDTMLEKSINQVRTISTKPTDSIST